MEASHLEVSGAVWLGFNVFVVALLLSQAGSARAQGRLATSYVKLGDAGDPAQSEERYIKTLSLRKDLAEKGHRP